MTGWPSAPSTGGATNRGCRMSPFIVESDTMVNLLKLFEPQRTKTSIMRLLSGCSPAAVRLLSVCLSGSVRLQEPVRQLLDA